MRRKVAVIGFSLAIAALCCAIVPPRVRLPAAAILVFLAVADAVVHLRKTNLWAWPVWLGLCLGVTIFFWVNALRICPLQRYDGKTMTCTVTVECDRTASFAEGFYRGTLLVTQVDGTPVRWKVYCPAFPDTAVGETFCGRFTLSWPGLDAYSTDRKADGVFLNAEYLDGYQQMGTSRAPRFMLYRLRQMLCQQIKWYLPEELGGLEAAMLLGERNGLSQEMKQTFQAAGVSHMLAVSGLHLTLLCGVLPGGGEIRRRYSRRRIFLQSALALFYMALTGFPVSVMRAGAVFLVCQLGYLLYQPPDTLTSMGIVAAAMTLVNPYAPCDIGFQLSFCAAVGMQGAAALSRWEGVHLVRHKSGWRPKRPQEKTPTDCFIERAGKAALSVQAAAFAAAATLPVLLAHGMTTSGSSLLTNVLVVWSLKYLLLMGLGVLALSILPILSPAKHMLSLVLAAALNLLRLLVQWCAALPIARLSLPKDYTLFVLAVIGLLCLLFYRKHRLAMSLPAVAVCVAVAVALEMQLEHNVVRVALVGNASTPCAVVTENNQAMVLFRGGNANLNAVEDYLALHGSPPEVLLIDLRQSPRELTFAAEQVIALDDTESQAIVSTPIFDDVSAQTYHTESGNLAVLNAGGYHIGICSGSLGEDKLEPVSLDVLLAGSAQPNGLSPAMILARAHAMKWMDVQTVGDTPIYVGGETPEIVIRPEKSISIREANRYELSE